MTPAPQPLIGLTCTQIGEYTYGRPLNGLSVLYSQGITAVGGVPVLLPNLPEQAEAYAQRLDAVLFSGGADIHPRLYGKEPARHLGATDDARDDFEVALYHAARKLGKPVFGICRGLQLINALEGGTLHQHLPDVTELWVGHSQVVEPPALGHSIQFVEGSRLARTHGPEARLNSYHHQGIERLAPTLEATAHAPDGLIEGVEGEGIVAVQWHPEMMFGKYPVALGAFAAFMELLK